MRVDPGTEIREGSLQPVSPRVATALKIVNEGEVLVPNYNPGIGQEQHIGVAKTDIRPSSARGTTKVDGPEDVAHGNIEVEGHLPAEDLVPQTWNWRKGPEGLQAPEIEQVLPGDVRGERRRNRRPKKRPREPQTHPWELFGGDWVQTHGVHVATQAEEQGHFGQGKADRVGGVETAANADPARELGVETREACVVQPVVNPQLQGKAVAGRVWSLGTEAEVRVLVDFTETGEL